MKVTNPWIVGAIAAAALLPATVSADPVGITPDIMKVTVKHDGKEMDIMRNQDNKATVSEAFAKTSRPCPPFCIQPIHLAPGVETIGEVEMVDYARRMSEGDDSIVLIDSRTPDWVSRGSIPSAINLPWTKLNPAMGATNRTRPSITG